MLQDEKEVNNPQMPITENDNQRFSKKKINIIKTVCMLLCLTIIFGGLTIISDSYSFVGDMGFHYSRFRGYRNEPENTIDVVNLASSTGRAWLPTYAWDNYGITSYNLSSSAQPFRAAKLLIENMIFDNQKPSVIIVDLGSAIKEPSSIEPYYIREISDNLGFFDRIVFLNDILSYAKDNENICKTDLWSYYFPFLWEHNNYYNLLSEDGTKVFNRYSTIKGTLTYTEFYSSEKQWYEKIPENLEPLELSEKPMQTLEEFIDFCDARNDFEVVFTIMPKAGERKEENNAGTFEEENRHIKFVVDYVRQRGYKVLNFMENEYLNELSLDYEKDFMDERHMCVYGGMKFTDYMCKYILENYKLPDRTSDEAIVKNFSNASQSFSDLFSIYTSN